MKTKIKEVQDYFKSKLIAGDFEILEICYHTIKVSVENEYEFSIWIANWANPSHCELYKSEPNFIVIPFTEDEKSILHDVIEPYRAEYLRSELKKEIEEKTNLLNSI